ncbi:hypothetical protein AB0O51_27785 [Streptomyces sp. NPDC090301]|uniref:hypothetical protein n=1 Tax=Streptomyces sp. NPDC090301 TaxID=3154975 RepID=UPI0034151CAB
MTANPSCDRRALLDAAGIDKDAIAAHLGLPRPLRKSQLALDYGIAFERQVTRQEEGALVPLLRQALGLALPAASYKDINSVGSDSTSPMGLRHTHTSSLILSAARHQSEPYTLLDHPVLTLNVAGQQAYLEPDVIAFHHDDIFHIVEIKSFPVIHGQPDPVKVTAALTQAAAYVLAMRELLAGFPPDRVSDTVILINPRNFSRHPTATRYNAAPQIRHLSRHLARLRRMPDLLDTLPAGTTCDLVPGPDAVPTRPRDEVIAALATMQPHYVPTCRNHCDLAAYCRTEARNRDSIGALGPAVRDDLAGIDTITAALNLADGHMRPTADRTDVTHALRHAQRIHDELRNDNT